MIEKLEYKLPTIECNYKEGLLLNCVEANKSKINEIINYLNEQEKTLDKIDEKLEEHTNSYYYTRPRLKPVFKPSP